MDHARCDKCPDPSNQSINQPTNQPIKHFPSIPDRVMLVQRYHKSEALTHSPTKICRFLPPALSNLMINMLFITRPLAASFSEQLGRPWDRTHLFVIGGNAMRAEAIRRTYHATLTRKGFDLNLSAHR